MTWFCDMTIIIAFDKERLHNAVETDIFGRFIDTNLPPPPSLRQKKLFRGEIIQGK